MQTTRPPVSESALLTVEQVAEMLRISPRHVYRLADAGRMPQPVRLGGAVRWCRQTLNDWIGAGCPNVERQKGGRR